MRVIKIGGRAQNDEKLVEILKLAWDEAPGALCIVHGGGNEVSELQRAMGREAAFVGGRRVTSKGDLNLLRMVLSGAVNKKLVNAFQSAGVPAVGLSGEDGALIDAEQIDATTLGFAGRPRKINASLLRLLLSGGYMPVISPVSFGSARGRGINLPLNVNGDDAATAIAAALDADELLFIADVRGVRDENGEFIQSLSVDQARELIARGVAAEGMAAKLESAGAAVAAGVERVRISDLAGVSDQNRGTCLTQSAGIAS